MYKIDPNSILARLWNSIPGGHMGSWGTKDFGLTERGTDALGFGRTADGGSDFLYTPQQTYTPQWSPQSERQYQTPGQILGTYDDKGDQKAPGTGGAKTTNNQDDNSADIARQRWLATIDQARRYLENATKTRNDILGSIGGFRDRAKNLWETGNQEITNKASELSGGIARTGQEMKGQARALGRSMGLGDSSKFNQQQGILSRLAADQGSVLARQGENEMANKNLLDERYAQADDQEASLNNWYQQAQDTAAGIESGGVADYTQNLNDIVNYNRQMSQLGMNAGGLTGYNPNMSGITGTLNSAMSGMRNQNQNMANNNGVNLANPLTIDDYLRRQGIYTG